MEKTADYQYVVKNVNGKLILRLPGGTEIDYDNRFADLPFIGEGDQYVIPKGD